MDDIAVEFGRTFRHDGRRLVFDVYEGGPDVVVYLHGLLLDSELHRGFASRLAAKGFTVVLMDLLGHGRSDAPTHASEYRIDHYAAETIALLDHLGVEQAVLGGLSLGANTSLLAATTHPERVRGLVLEMPVLEWAVPAAALVFAPMILAAHYGRPILQVTSRLLRRVPRTGFGPLDSVLNSGSVSPEVMAAVLHGVLVGPVAPTGDARRAITAPALVVGHRNDLIHPFDDASNLMHQLPDARLVSARTALDYRIFPGRLADEVADFLAGLEPATPRATRGGGSTRPLRRPG